MFARLILRSPVRALGHRRDLLTISCYHPTMIGYEQQAVHFGCCPFRCRRCVSVMSAIRFPATKRRVPWEGSKLDAVDCTVESASPAPPAGCADFDGGVCAPKREIT